MEKYDPAEIEPKWQAWWKKKKLDRTPEPTGERPKKYVLDMYPYPSGAVLHVGHMEGYVATDVFSRYLRMKGFSVLHPMGWDAFGLPAENYAIKTGVPPDQSTHKNIDTFRQQLKMLGLSYDWDREIDTSDPDYYKWTQWLFILLFKMGLAYKKKAPANWCPSCETVLANEQVVDGKCERCGTPVVQKDLDQWFFKITAYADRLIEGLDRIDWPKSTRLMQKNWIGRKEGSLIKFGVVEVFTTRPETILGAAFVVLSPNHPLAGKVKTVTNPATEKEIPVFVDEYVLDEVGTGAIMGVPAYDQRDLVFAKKHNLPVVEAKFTDQVYGKKAVTYHLRDWLVSRQRYWGAPIPMIWCEKCQWQPVPEEELPVRLPTDVDFRPTGESPIGRSASFQRGVVCPNCHGPARREVDTMDTFVDSSWYFLRFVDPRNKKEFAAKNEIKKWLPVDTYVGGGHTVQHLLFARFFEKVLFDAGYLGKSVGDEPFSTLKVPGWILGPDSRKMSKRWNNVITPDDVVEQYGADTMRLYEMFMAPFEVDKPWNVNSVAGVHRFVNRIYNLSVQEPKPTDDALTIALNRLVQKVGADIESFKFNTAVAAMMEFVNLWEKSAKLSLADREVFIKILAPFVPHLAQELWSRLGRRDSVHQQAWPQAKAEAEVIETVRLAVCVNGKTRAVLEIGSHDKEALKEDKVIAMAQNQERVAKNLAGKKILKTVYVPGKIINFVTA
ncbi:MAG: leucine--tRNA ligase [Patescibacteria group bacterium]|nr:leucine--tRNA ligase [Patescibacteria group bacterium]MCL5432301.1 leucine--tRNA ligase [Patescibacteria group bacterium]